MSSPLAPGGSIAALAAAICLTAACSSSSPAAPSSATAAASSATISITGTLALKGIGQTSQLVASTSAGIDVTATATWQSSNPAVATAGSTGLITSTGIGTALISAGYHGAASTVTFAVASTTTTILTSCQSIQMPGTYTLAGDLGPPTTPGSCLYVTNIPAVQIDCAGHSLSSLTVTNASDVTISNCTIEAPVNVNQSTGVSIDHCRVTGYVGLSHATSTIVSGNVIDASTALSAAIFSTSGSHNQLLENTMTGGYDGGPANRGADDGILLAGESDDLVENNTISGFYDAGIEGVGVLARTEIGGNTITNVGYAGISSYWCTNWTNVSVKDNVVMEAPVLLLAAYDTGSKCGASMPPPVFSDNTISGNRAVAPAAGTRSTYVQGMVVSLTAAATVTNNVIQGNDFGIQLGPFVLPPSGFTDAGGNRCGSLPAGLVSNFPCSGG